MAPIDQIRLLSLLNLFLFLNLINPYSLNSKTIQVSFTSTHANIPLIASPTGKEDEKIDAKRKKTECLTFHKRSYSDSRTLQQLKESISIVGTYGFIALLPCEFDITFDASSTEAEERILNSTLEELQKRSRTGNLIFYIHASLHLPDGGKGYSKFSKKFTSFAPSPKKTLRDVLKHKCFCCKKIEIDEAVEKLKHLIKFRFNPIERRQDFGMEHLKTKIEPLLDKFPLFTQHVEIWRKLIEFYKKQTFDELSQNQEQIALTCKRIYKLFLSFYYPSLGSEHHPESPKGRQKLFRIALDKQHSPNSPPRSDSSSSSSSPSSSPLKLDLRRSTSNSPVPNPQSNNSKVQSSTDVRSLSPTVEFFTVASSQCDPSLPSTPTSPIDNQFGSQPGHSPATNLRVRQSTSSNITPPA